MRYITFLFFFSLPVFAQTNRISVISAEKLNVVYRGVPNPIKIAVPGVDPSKVIVSAPGLIKAEVEGNYILTPSPAKEVTIYITYITEDGAKKSERKVMRIKELPLPIGALNSEGCSKCIFETTKEELLDSEINVLLKDFLFVDIIIVDGFTVIINGNHIENKFEVIGNTIDKETSLVIKSMPAGTRISIDNIQYHMPGVNAIYKKPSPIVVEIKN